MRKRFSLLLVILLIGCKRDVALVTPTAITAVSTPNATRFVTLSTETAVSTTITTATPSEMATASPTAVQTSTPTPSSTPTGQFAIPTLPPVAKETGDSDELYHLRPWSDVEAAALVSLMTDYANGFMVDWELYDWYGDQGRQEIIELGREFILRYPNSPLRVEVEWQMVDASTYIPSTYFPSREFDELLAKLIEADLNAGVTSLATLDMYLHSRGLQVSLKGCQSCTPFPSPIPNLLGDGRKIPLFLIERQTGNIDGAVLLAIWQDADTNFIVIPILSQWAAFTRFSGGISNFEARHITGDSQPELLIEEWGHSGSIRGVSLHMYRWDGEKFVQLAGTPFKLGDEWEFVEGDDPSRLQVIHTYDNSMTIFQWTGESYERLEIAQEDVPPDPTDTYSAALWIHQGIEQGNYAEVVAYLEEALQKPDSSYPCGTQYQCVLRFVLGMNYVYLEDEEMARTVFKALRDETSSPELIGFSQAAGAFLEHYDGLESAYEACGSAYDVLLTTELELADITELLPLCAYDKLFVEGLEQYDGIGSVFDFVDAAQIYYAQQHDLNSDGRSDWLLALSHRTLSTRTWIEGWAVLQMDAETEIVKLKTLRPIDEKVEEFRAEIHLFPPFETPMIAIQSDNFFSLLQLVPGEAGWESKLHMSNVQATDYSLQMVENNLQLDLFFDATTSYGGFDRITFQWDAEMEKFVEVSRHAPNSLRVPFSEALVSAETLIFENGDFAAAVSILTSMADEFEPTADYGWEFSLPKTLYLLGLAHEMQGNEAEAVAAYWQLWHDYPTDPYALIAAAKLEGQ